MYRQEIRLLFGKFCVTSPKVQNISESIDSNVKWTGVTKKSDYIYTTNTKAVQYPIDNIHVTFHFTPVDCS